MNRHNDRLDPAFDPRIADWLEADPDRAPVEVIDTILAALPSIPQRRTMRGLPWRFPTMPSSAKLALTAVAIVAVGLVGLTLMRGPAVGPAASPSPTASPSSAEVTELLNNFLEARVAGKGAQQYLNVPEEDIPLLYATTSGAPYERAEFEQVLGIEWPYGFMAFKVRLFARDTVVEQLFFTPPDGRLGLEYVDNGFGTDIAPTTEDGKPLAIPRNYFDGEVTLRAAHPWVFGGIYAALIPEGPGVRPTTDGGDRQHWDKLWLLADPVPVGTGCQAGPAPADAAALAESIRSDPDLEATAPVAVNVRGARALTMDVMIAAGASICQYFGRPEALTNEQGDLLDINLQTGRRMRLYLFDVPEGSSMRMLAIAIVAPESTFERAVEAAAPVVDSLEFPTK